MQKIFTFLFPKLHCCWNVSSFFFGLSFRWKCYLAKSTFTFLLGCLDAFKTPILRDWCAILAIFKWNIFLAKKINIIWETEFDWKLSWKLGWNFIDKKFFFAFLLFFHLKIVCKKCFFLVWRLWELLFYCLSLIKQITSYFNVNFLQTLS